MAIEMVPPRFFVRAGSRFPRLQDYNSGGHQFEKSYVNPTSYTITIEFFPGMHLVQKGTNPDENQTAGSGGHLHYSPDIYKLDCPPNTTGWVFTLDGRISQPAAGRNPSDPEVHLLAKTSLPSLTGPFAVVGTRNPAGLVGHPWDWNFEVEGQGTFTLTAHLVSGNEVIDHRDATLTIKDYLIASIGDSAASGEGNPDVPGIPADLFSHPWWEYIIPFYDIYVIADDAYNWGKEKVATNVPAIAAAGEVAINMDPKPIWLEEKAHRSLRSGHAYAAQSLEDLYAGTVVTFLPFGPTPRI